MRTNVKRRISPAHRRTPITRMLKDAGSSATEVARLADVSATTVTLVMQGKHTSARIQGIIERILKKPWNKLIAAERS